MIVRPAAIPDVLILEPRVFEDARGSFFESYQETRYAEAGIAERFVQDSVSWSGRNTLRGLHLQHPRAQGKLVSCLHGEVLDVAVDLRPDSPTLGQHVSQILSGENKHQVWIPAGFAHGFLVLSDVALFHYKCTAAYDPQGQLSVLWNDPELGIEWPVDAPVLSPRDAAAPRFEAVAALLRD